MNVKRRLSLDMLREVDCTISACLYVVHLWRAVAVAGFLLPNIVCLFQVRLFADRLDHALCSSNDMILPLDLFVCFNNSQSSASTVCRKL